jgi:hypothetical protein
MLALIAAQEAAVIASGHGSSLMAPIGAGTVDGFAAGMVLSAVVFMLILAQRRAGRRPVRAAASRTPAGPPALAPALDDALGQNPPPPLAAPVEVGTPVSFEAAALAMVGAAAAVEAPAFAPVMDAALNTHPYADVSPYGRVNSGTEVMPFADAANEVLLQPGIRLEEWLEGQMRRPSLPRSSRGPAAEHDEEKPPAPVPAAVVAAEATTAVVPATPAPEAVEQDAEEDDPADQRRASAYQSKHRMPGRNDSKPWSENHRRTARHAAAPSARSGAMSRRFGLRQLRPVSAGD